MFSAIPEPVVYADPWKMTLATRLRMLTARPRRVAYFHERPDTSTFRYRAFNMTECLAADERADASAGWFDHNDLKAGATFVDLADVLVICRARYDGAVAGLIARARARRIPVLFDCDDLVFDPAKVPLLIDTLALDNASDQVWTDWFALTARLGATFRLCDGFITTNAFLAARGREVASPLYTAVVPNYLNEEQQALSQDLHKAKQRSDWARDTRLHIGYFSGSPSHRRDFKVAEPAILRLLQRDRRIVLRIVGLLELGADFDSLRDRVEFFPLQDFMNLQRLVAEVEISIAPLQDNVFTNCKSELKFFEAAACGTVTVATPTFTFRKAIRHGENGFLAAAHEWDAVLAEAIRLVDDGRAYAAMANLAAREVGDEYGWNQQTGRIVDAVFGAAA